MTTWQLEWWPFALTVSVAIGGALAPLVRSFLERLVGFQFDRRMEELRYDVRVREQASKVAEYLATAVDLDRHEDRQVFRRVRQLDWEMALFLPADIYRHVSLGLNQPDEKRNALSALLAARKHLLGSDAGDLGRDEILVWGPHVGAERRET